jgi:putative sigma-54 modulation protein
MKILVRTSNLAIGETFRAHIERRLEFSLGRFAARLARVAIQVSDTNGPRGGTDKLCRIEVRLRGAPTVFVEDCDASLQVAVDRAAERVGRSVGRAIKRERDRDRGCLEPITPAP